MTRFLLQALLGIVAWVWLFAAVCNYANACELPSKKAAYKEYRELRR